jgi:phosphocarrier protein HPr
MIRSDIEIINKLGLHARAASKLVNMASQFSSAVFIENKGNKVNAKSIMGVMMLAASQGTALVLEVNGDDEQKCTDSIIELINNRFDEAE